MTSSEHTAYASLRISTNTIESHSNVNDVEADELSHNEHLKIFKTH